MRHLVALALFVPLILPLRSEAQPVAMPQDTTQDFPTRMGFARRAPRPPTDGVVADWSQLPAETKAYRARWSLLAHDVRPVDDPAGAAAWRWVYAGKAAPDDRLTVEVIAFAAGQAAAIAKMTAISHSSHMAQNPYGPAPESMRLGDWTAVAFPEHAAQAGETGRIFWVLGNVLADVRVSGDDETEVLPIARAVQAFMARHQVSDLPARLPAAHELTISPARVTVGQEFRAELTTATPLPAWRYRIQIVDGEAEPLTQDGPVATYRATAAGTVTLDAVVYDAQTLLSARRRATVEVAGERRP
jgi:hypothetical protein